MQQIIECVPNFSEGNDMTVIGQITDTIEAVVNFSVESGPPYNNASIRVFLDDRDWLLSDLKAEATEKAKAFVMQVASSHQT